MEAKTVAGLRFRADPVGGFWLFVVKDVGVLARDVERVGAVRGSTAGWPLISRVVGCHERFGISLGRYRRWVVWSVPLRVNSCKAVNLGSMRFLHELFVGM